MMTGQKALLNNIVWVDPDRMSGEPCFKGTRVPVQGLIDHIECNSTLDDFLDGFPSVTHEQAIRLIEFTIRDLITSVLGWERSEESELPVFTIFRRAGGV